MYLADSQIVYTEMVAERKTEESIPYDSKKHRGYTEQNIRLACVLSRGMLKGMLTPCVRIASDTPDYAMVNSDGHPLSIKTSPKKVISCTGKVLIKSDIC